MRKTGLRALLRLQPLEARDVPATPDVVTVVRGNTLFLLGDNLNDSVVLSQPLGPGTITITPTAGTLLNGQSLPQAGLLAPNLTIELGAGTDSVTFDLGTNPFLVQNALTIDYGTAGIGNKVTQTTGAIGNNLTVGGNFGIRYAAGIPTTTLDNLSVAGGLTVLHGTGDSNLTIDNQAGAGRFSAIGGNLLVTNVMGVATNVIQDTNVAGSVTITNGRARTSDGAAGSTTIDNRNNTTLATIGGSVSITNVSGNNTTGDVIGDVSVTGNVTLALGTGTFPAKVAAQNATTGPTVSGNLKITASTSGTSTIQLGAPVTGLTVKKALTVRSGNKPAVFTLDDVSVTGATSLFTGNGNDTISIDGTLNDVGSTFTGGFNLGSGPGTDILNINSGAATAAVTTFKGALTASLGTLNDTLNLANAGIVNFANKVPVFNGSTGTNTKNVTTLNLEGKTPTFLHFV
jgi:hypothetical protein